MSDNTRTFVMTALAFGAGMLIASAGGPRAARAEESAAPPPDLSSRVAYLERAYKGVYADIQYLKQTVRQQGSQQKTAGAGTQKVLEAKVAELEKKLDGHTHEYLQEGRASDGSIRDVPNDQFSGAGLNSTGIFKIGRPVFH